MDSLHGDIEKYLKGELSPAEMHALEKRALNDPFLADALEGASSIDVHDFSSDLKSLKEGLTHQDSTVKVLPIWVWASRIAAGIAAVGVITLLVFFPKKQHDEIASAPSAISSDSITVTAKEEPVVATDTQETAPSVSKDNALAYKPREGVQHEKTEVPMATIGEVQGEADTDVNQSLSMNDADAPASSAPGAATSFDTTRFDIQMGDKAKAEARRKPLHVIKGKVTEAEEGKALPGVNVTIKGTNLGTITDAEGYFQIPMDSLNTGLMFSFIGFESTEVTVPGFKNELNVAMQPDIAQLSEVVVVGYGAEKKEEDEYPLVEMAYPVGGRKAFKEYLMKNLKYPDQALNNEIEGKVTIQFTIETTGRLSEFRVLKGIGYGCEEEVIRLIKEGPKWSATKRNAEPIKDRVKVRMKFALPKKTEPQK